MSESAECYTAALKIDERESERYYAASLRVKTEQQKQLKGLLRNRHLQPKRIADIACGGGAASHRLGAMFPEAPYTLVDLTDEAIGLARQATAHLQAICVVGDIYALPLESNSFDLVICWQTLSWLDRTERALYELTRICRPSGRVYASSLFNSRHHVDVQAIGRDHTRASAAQGQTYTYNAYAISSVRHWVEGTVSELEVHEFSIPVDLHHEGMELVTYTVALQNGGRLQISAGMLLNWGILELRK